MALRLALSNARKDYGVSPIVSSLGYFTSKTKSEVPILSFQTRVEKRQITTSKSRALASSFKFQSSLATALVQEDADLTPYSFQYPTRNTRNSSPRIRTIPRELSIKEQVAETSKEVAETLDNEISFGPEEAYWQKISRWSDVTRGEFLRYSWQVS